MNRLLSGLLLFTLTVVGACVPSRLAFAADASGGAFTVGGVAVPICRIDGAEGAIKRLNGVGSPAGRCGRAVNGSLASVVDATSKSDCSVGGGTVVTVCQYDAAQSGANKWVPGIGSGSGDQVSVNGSATVDPSFNSSSSITFSAASNIVQAAIASDAVTLGAQTTGAYVAGATTGGGLSLTGSEGGTLGLLACSSGEVLKYNGSAWACATDSGGNSFAFISPSSGAVVMADSTTDTLSISAGSGIVVTGNATTDTITIDSTLGTTVGPTEMQATDFGSFSCNGTTCSLDASSVTDTAIGSGVDAAKLSSGVVSNAEFDRLDGVSSGIQSQLDAKLAKAGDTMSGQLNMGASKITNLAAGSASSDAVRFDQVPAASTLILRDGSQAWSANQPVGGYKLTGLGAPTAGSTDAARHADLAFVCGSTANTCARVEDSNGDGNIAPEFQTAINAVLWPGGTLTTATDVYLAAPKQGTYNLASRIIICGDTSPPSGSTAPDCTGNTQQLPRIHFIGAWSSAVLSCTHALSNVVQNIAPCIQIGDAWADSGDFAHKVPLAFDTPLVLKYGTESDFTNTQMLLWCNGCTGDLKLEAQPGSVVFAGPVAVVAGGALRSSINAVFATSTTGTIVFDGEQSGSSAAVQSYMGASGVRIGSAEAATLTFWGPADGCSYNGYTGTCSDFHLLPESRIAGSDLALDVSDTDGATIEGVVEGGGSQKPAINVATGLGSYSVRSLIIRAGCHLGSGSYNSCIRLYGNSTPSFTSTVTLDGPVISAKSTGDTDKGGIGCNNHGAGSQPVKIILGPGASMQNTAGGYASVLNSINPYGVDREPCNTAGPNPERVSVRVPSQTLGTLTSPSCLDLKDGTWRACTDERTRLRRPSVPALWLQRVGVRLYGNAAATTSCNVRAVKNNTTPAGNEDAGGAWGPYYPNGHPFRIGADGLRATGDYHGFNVTAPSDGTADYWQIQVDDDYSNLGGQEGCLTTVSSGYATSNGSTVLLNDNTKAWTTNEHSTAGRRIVFDAGAGALAIRSITSNTATSVSWSGALSASTYGSANGQRTKYRIVAGSGSCACASETLPEMDVTLDMFEMR